MTVMEHLCSISVNLYSVMDCYRSLVVNAPLVETGARARTRRAILDAAVTVLSGNATASLGEVAQAAEVGRTTLHRYFPERSDLLRALGQEAVAAVAQAIERSRPDDGTGLDALQRLCRELFDLGDLLMMVFNQSQFAELLDWESAPWADQAQEAVVVRGHRDGTIDPGFPQAWVVNLVWTLLYSGWSYVTDSKATRHEALDLTLACLTRSVSADRPPHGPERLSR